MITTKKTALSVAAALLLISMVRHYGWDWFDDGDKGMASKGLGGVALLASAWLVYALAPHRIVLAVAIFWSWQEWQVVMCSFSYIYSPWPVAPGQAICSAVTGFDLGAASLIATAFLARWLAVRLYR